MTANAYRAFPPNPRDALRLFREGALSAQVQLRRHTVAAWQASSVEIAMTALARSHLRWGLSLCTQLEPLSQHPERQTNDVAKWLTEAVAFLLAVAQFPRGLENRRRVCRSVVRRLPPTMATNHFVSVEQLLDLGSASLPP